MHCPSFPFRKRKTSDFFEGKCRCFALKVRMFPSKKSGVFGFPYSDWESFRPSPLKMFVKKSYISYTNATDILYLLMV